MTINYVVVLAEFLTGLVLVAGVILILFSYFTHSISFLLVGGYSYHITKRYKIENNLLVAGQ